MQDLPRLHAPPRAGSPFAPAAELPMLPGQAHYLAHVLRRKVGDQVLLFNQQDGAWSASIVALRKDRGAFALEALVRPPAPEPGPMLLFAPLRRDPTDLVIRIATELGVAAIRPVITERTNSGRINAARWQAIATEAAEQCERLSVPHIAAPVSLPALLQEWDPGCTLLAGLERATDPDTRVAPGAWRAGAPPGMQPGLLVGPEGGFSPAERRLIEACGFVVPVRLGPLILRAETACLAGLAALRC